MSARMRGPERRVRPRQRSLKGQRVSRMPAAQSGKLACALQSAGHATPFKLSHGVWSSDFRRICKGCCGPSLSPCT
jgi:hypothetical protein